MLLPDLVNKDDLAASLPELQVDKRARNRGKEEHIHKDEDDEVDVVGLEVLDGQDVVIRVGIVGG